MTCLNGHMNPVEGKYPVCLNIQTKEGKSNPQTVWLSQAVVDKGVTPMIKSLDVPDVVKDTLLAEVAKHDTTIVKQGFVYCAYIDEDAIKEIP